MAMASPTTTDTKRVHKSKGRYEENNKFAAGGK